MPDIETDKKIINHPQRYGGDTQYECVKVLKAWMSEEEYRGWLKGSAIKYLCRLGKKDDAVQELNKSAWYVNKLIESYKEEKAGETSEINSECDDAEEENVIQEFIDKREANILKIKELFLTDLGAVTNYLQRGTVKFIRQDEAYTLFEMEHPDGWKIEVPVVK